MKREKLDEDRRPVSVARDSESDEARESPVPPSADELEHALLDEAAVTPLPNPPAMPGWHLFWASTTNQYTPVQYYYRLGYTHVKPEELPSMSELRLHSGEQPGMISVNEMVLLKTTQENYQRYMKIMHHDRPLSEAERLKSNVDAMKQEVGEDREGRQIVMEEGDGFADIAKRRKAPSHFE